MAEDTFNITNMSNDVIIQQLRDKELHLLNELNKVRLALQAFIGDNTYFSSQEPISSPLTPGAPAKFDKHLTYGNKILFILAQAGQPLLVDEIAKKLHELEPDLNTEKLHKSIGHNLCMLAKYSRVKKHPFNRKIKYSV